MAWPYHFVDLDADAKALRREALDRYALYSQLLVLLPVVGLLARRVLSNAFKSSSGDDSSPSAYSAVPDSPQAKSRRSSAWGSRAGALRAALWWLGGEVHLLGEHRGERLVWLLGGGWAAWLLLLCFLETGDDYLHLTKRFGIVAAAQLPIQYLLSLKYLNPFAYVFRTSHEEVNKWHRVLGRIIYMLLLLHVVFYVNFLAQAGVLGRRIFAPIVFAGVVSWAGINLLMATALPMVRRFSYRIFFVTHLFVSFAVPVLIFFHAPPVRVSVCVALASVLADITVRRLRTMTGRAVMEAIPGTDLVKVTVAIPPGRSNAFRQHPGSHVYVSIPEAARPDLTSTSSLIYEFLFNPFTVADVDEATGDLTLVARRRTGPMTAALARFAKSSGSAAHANYDETRIPLFVEGPYGAAKHFPNLAGPGFDRVLLVAGGVGATFAVPLYRAIRHDNPSAKVELVWALRGAGDATWADKGPVSILADENVHLFLTGPLLGDSAASGSSLAVPDGDGGTELNALYRRGGRLTAQHNRRRPDLRRLVDDVFRHGSEERVAVLVCGPEEMVRETRRCVGPWVSRGREVWWHNESFGW
ncbi:metalloreductase Fre8 [Gaeumannomyces tritici R3-111a-1]|uniref:Metalloreductase Fre8 n=1 Tax=Gaeumannomyces tritici (strain R3-111a-1) TaxID=644352 RepID=J3NVW3_GAET3|nr:metalloreductase Fre8 [Gaeumannomyces tritici R3-111a-1]EJT75492.1 metalloreductase Fre8 [Gaeumannomyces tritici R3-111a-1]